MTSDPQFGQAICLWCMLLQIPVEKIVEVPVEKIVEKILEVPVEKIVEVLPLLLVHFADLLCAHCTSAESLLTTMTGARMNLHSNVLQMCCLLAGTAPQAGLAGLPLYVTWSVDVCGLLNKCSLLSKHWVSNPSACVKGS